ncbi:NAD(P)H-dependent oxidoreductase [Roseicyclus mahoneyensis]|uniref:NAD(P)H dehydrogenase (Quinone) n=1 Tax=Roseicyclus mahoneyensis TaxID=164332 RepID=A0A316GGH8_9RHOB|nr:NAD(P)H-dependent oxidoreductase [Roseicyclus mahoneyensis]PWK60149.1 NAD(P)H dehydrogenase (quinone) [Roseicyclus mahoneyensis]
MGRTTLIVLAHPEPGSFCGAWAEASAKAAEAEGDRVLWSDLYAMGFHPAEGPERYTDPPAPFDALKAQEQAAGWGHLPADVAAEVDKIRSADRIVFHFPIWWFAPPAMLKGWCDRTLLHGLLHAVDQRFDSGVLRGKRALFCVTTGARDSEAGRDGKEGETRLLLWPLAYTLRYCGMEVAEPVLVHGVHGYHEGARKAALEARLAQVLADQRAVIAGLAGRALMPFNVDRDFDGEGRLRHDAPSHWPFIRHVD